MVLYHFTAKHLWKSIKKQGVILGMVPTVQYPKMRGSKQYRWLTSNPNFKQNWDGNKLINYSRTDVRITIDIPDEKNLIQWLKYCARKKDDPFIQALNNPDFAPAEWYLYKGNISPEWFKEIDFKDSLGK